VENFSLLSALALMWVPLHLFLAGYYLVFHLRERAKDHLLFSGLWFLAALYSLACAGLYSAASPEDGLAWQKLQFLAAISFFPLAATFLWGHAVGRLPGRVKAVLVVLGGLFVLANFTSPWFWTDTPSVKTFVFLGQTVTYHEMTPGWLGLTCFAWGMALLVLSSILAILAMKKRRPGSLPLMAGLLVLIGCGINDSLVSGGVYRSLYLVEHGFPVFAFAAAYFMQTRVFTVQAILEARTADLERANAELGRALERLSAIDRLKEDLLTNVSHDLRTPLVSVQGYIEAILAGKLGPVTPRQEDGLRVALRNTSRLLGLIGNLLDFAKLEDGSLQLQRRPMDLGDVVRDALDTALPLAKGKGIHLAADLPRGQAMTLLGDSAKLQQVLDNLIHNAVKYTDPGGKITVRTERAVEGRLRVVVEDNGMGIHSDELERIFERFYRSPRSDARGASGTGIGLSLSRSLARLHGGELRAIPKSGGACLELTLPCCQPGEAAEAAMGAQAPRLTGGAGPEAEPEELSDTAAMGSPNLLLVDDDLDVLELFSMALREDGCKVQVAKDGESGLCLARSQRFDLMLLDLTMRGMGGVEVLEALHRDPPSAALPVVVVTALGSDEVRQRCLASGASDFLVKPVPLAELRRAVQRVLLERARSNAVL
jgi:signal transduction histidine kinase/CheY-like chemotaxis protein